MKYNSAVLSSSTLEGDKVKNAQGEDLGDLKEIMINTESGQVQYSTRRPIG
jgi:sporulation protein YlmC with PRC-barrel domain